MSKYSEIEIYQDGKRVETLLATPAQCADHTGWRPYSLMNVTVILPITRSQNLEQRFFAGFRCITRFPEYGHEFQHNAQCDMAPGVSNGKAIVESYNIPMNFKEFKDTFMEIEFTFGGKAAESSRKIPIKIPSFTHR